MKEINIPLGPKEMRDFFEDKSQLFWVDYKKSPLKGNVFLTYIANLGLNVEFDFTSLASSDKIEFIAQYMESRHIIKCDTLSIATMQLLMHYRGFNPEQDIIQHFFYPEELDECCKANEKQIKTWVHFLDSSLIYLFTVYEDLEKELNIKESFERVDDHRYVGLNIVNLFRTEGFFEIYFALPVERISYFVRQFEEYMFNGQNLFAYFNSDENTFIKLLEGVFSDKINFDEIKQSIEI